MGRACLILVVLGFLTITSACGEVDDPPSDDGAGGSGGAGGSDGGGGTGGDATPGEIGPIEWATCEGGSPNLRCAEISVPLDWTDAASERIGVFVRRWKTDAATRRGQLWLLQGGPGFGAEGLMGYAPFFAAEGFDVYLPDYRGVGRSTPLACVGEESSYDVSTECMADLIDRWGDGIRFFSSADAATDVGKAIEALKSDEDVFVIGTSYGTFVANKLLSLFPDLLSGAVLDSICSAKGCSIFTERNLNRSAERVFDLCGADPACSARLSTDPWGKLSGLMRRLVGGHCSAFAGEYTPHYFSRILGSTADVRTLVPVALAAAYRMDRCAPEDVVALQHFLAQATASTGFSPATQASYSAFTYFNLFINEFWEEGMQASDFLDEVHRLPIQTGSAQRLVRELGRWKALPTWTVPEPLRRWADVETPLLLLNGDLDARTPIWDLEGIDEAFSRPHQNWVEVPFGGHGIIMEGRAPGRLGTCGYRMITTFLAKPTGAPDTACLAGMETLDLEGDSLSAETIFGTSDLWENGVSKIRPPRDPDPAFDLAWERLREGFARPW